MITPKKPPATGSPRGAYEVYLELSIAHKLVDNDTDWMRNSKCHPDDGITWFPEQGQRHLTIQAKKFCADCPVKQRCLDWALNNEIMYGVWGGRSPKERETNLYAREYRTKMGL